MLQEEGGWTRVFQSCGIPGLPGQLGMTLPLVSLLDLNQNHPGDMIKLEMPPPHQFLDLAQSAALLPI